MWTIRSLALLVSLGSLPACAPTVWEKPGTTPTEFSADVGQCERTAEAASREQVAATDTSGVLDSIDRRMAVSHSREGCMASKGYVASASGAPRGSRTYKPLEMANLAASANIEYFRGNSAADLLRLQRSDSKLASSSPDRSGAAETTSTGADLLADLGVKWRQLVSTFNF